MLFHRPDQITGNGEQGKWQHKARRRAQSEVMKAKDMIEEKFPKAVDASKKIGSRVVTVERVARTSFPGLCEAPRNVPSGFLELKRVIKSEYPVLGAGIALKRVLESRKRMLTRRYYPLRKPSKTLRQASTQYSRPEIACRLVSGRLKNYTSSESQRSRRS